MIKLLIGLAGLALLVAMTVSAPAQAAQVRVPAVCRTPENIVELIVATAKSFANTLNERRRTGQCVSNPGGFRVELVARMTEATSPQNGKVYVVIELRDANGNLAYWFMDKRAIRPLNRTV